MPVAPASEATRFHVALGQDVQAPAANEFRRRQANGKALAVAARLIADPCPELDFTFIGADQSSIGDRTAGQIAAQIPNHVFWPAIGCRWRFDVGNPFR